MPSIYSTTETTSNHNLSKPKRGISGWDTDWYLNFDTLDTLAEIRGEESNRHDYSAKKGAKFFATDSHKTYIGTGTGWTEVPSTGNTPTFERASVKSAPENPTDVVRKQELDQYELDSHDHSGETLSPDTLTAQSAVVVNAPTESGDVARYDETIANGNEIARLDNQKADRIGDDLTPATVASTSKPWADVTAHGAVGDGTTDDTQAFLSALSAAQRIYVPEGTYHLIQSLTIGDGQVIMGDGRQQSILQFDAVDGIVTDGRADDWSVSDVQLTDSGSGAETVGFGIEGYSSRWSIDRCRIADFGRYGIHHSGLNWTVSRTTLENNGEGTTGDGVSVFCDGTELTATTGSFEHVYCRSGAEFAFLFDSVRQVELRNSIAEYHDVAFRAVDSSSVFVDMFWSEQISDPNGDGVVQSHDSNVVWKSERSPTPTRTWSGVAWERRYPADIGRLDLAWRDVSAGRELQAGERVGVSDGDVETEAAGNGLVVTTPDGTARYRIRVDNAGSLTTEQL